MNDLFENPMGLNGFEFVEFASPEPGVLEPLFDMLGFTEVASGPLVRSSYRADRILEQNNLGLPLTEGGDRISAVNLD